MDDQPQRQAQRVGEQVSLAAIDSSTADPIRSAEPTRGGGPAGDLPAGVAAARAAGLGGLDRLAVDDADGGRTPAAGTLACRHQEAIIQTEQRAVLPAAPEIAEHGAFGRELLGQQPP